MPLTSGVFARIWKFVDQKAAGQEVTRSDLDTALDDFVPAVNAALDMVASTTANAAAAQASAEAADASEQGTLAIVTDLGTLAAAVDATAADRVQTGLDRTAAAGSASTATTQAGIATTQAGVSTAQADIATTQAGIAVSGADAAAASALAAATFDPALYLAKSGNLSGLQSTSTALTNLGGTTVGAAVFTAVDAPAAQTAIGASVVGAAVLAAVDATAARTTLAAAALAGPTFTGQVKVASGTVGAPSLIQAGDVDTGLWFPAANTLAVSLAGAEKARFDGNYLRLAAGGIQFNGDTADANSLDDYEEGSFTPTISGAGVSGAGTYTLQTGRYVKVGKVVTIWGAVTITAHTGSGQMIIGGLPFTTANVANMKTVASILYLNLTVPAASFAVGFIGPNESWISMNSLATAATGYVSLSIDAACTLNFTATYEAA